jgi:hypothetical protein
LHRRVLQAALAATLSCIALGGTALAQGGRPEPSVVELETWRSATRINTPAAYAEYLSKFPDGSFAGMAQAAMRSGTGADAASAALLARAEALRQGTPETGAVTFRVGDRFHGPGIVRSGWYGAKRQIVLPAGEWVVLAAYDHFADSYTRVQMTSLAFGRFRGERLDSLIAFVSNSRQVPMSPNTTAAFPPPLALVERCTGNDDTVFTETTNTARQQVCTRITRQAVADIGAALPAGLGSRVTEVFQRLGGTVAGPTTRSVLETLSSPPHYAAYIRVDAEDTRDLKARVESFTRSRAALLNGLNYRYDNNDLVPGERPGATGPNIGD